jgi:hypothetical protein
MSGNKEGYTNKPIPMPFEGLTDHAKKNFGVDLQNKDNWVKDATKENQKPAANTGAQVTIGSDGLPKAVRTETIISEGGKKKVGDIDRHPTGLQADSFGQGIKAPEAPKMRKTNVRRVPLKQANDKAVGSISDVSSKNSSPNSVAAKPQNRSLAH